MNIAIRARIYQRLLRLEQSLFGLPLLILSALLALWNNLGSFTLAHLGMLIAGFMMARISGMAFNQLIDRAIDAKNPRTQGRPLPRGEIGVKKVATIAWGALLLFLGCAWWYSPLIFALALVASLLIFSYSYLKRFWAGCHFVLGAIHALGVVMAFAFIADTIALAPLLLGGAAALIVAGSDIRYAIADLAFDQAEQLHSLPVYLGKEKAEVVALLCHSAAVLLLVLFGWVAGFGLLYFLAPMALIGILLFAQKRHRLLSLFFNAQASLLTLLFAWLGR